MAEQTSFAIQNKKTEVKNYTLLKSYTKFAKYFKNCKSAKIISYCASPQKICKTFDNFNIEKLEIIVGNKVDYRESLVGESELANRLEKLKKKEKLIIYTRKTSNKPKIHCKLYIIHKKNNILILHGSPNFSKNAWGRQHESVTEFKTTRNSDTFQEFMELWEEEKNYCNRFLDDLTEKIEQSEQKREEVIKLWVQGKTSAQTDEIAEVNEKIVKEIRNTKNEDKISISLVNFSNETREHLKERHSSDNDTSISNELFNSSLSSVARGFNRVYGIPTLITSNKKVIFNHTEKRIFLNQDLPSNKEEIKKSLNHIESYLESINKYASYDNSRLVKTHMFEALLYFFWSPFINLYAEAYQNAGMLSAKNIPFLYIFGESDSGKSSYIKFLLNLISLGKVIEPMSAAEISMTNIRKLKQSMTCFPFIIDDIQKKQIHQYKPVLNSYWSGWGKKKYLPALIFSSNDNRPKEWFRNRAKMLDFNLQFEDTNKSQFESIQLMQKKNPIFKYYAQLHLNKINESGIDVKEDDFLYLSRKIFKNLYSRAEKELPPYFPERPAEEIYDPGVEEWQEAEEEGQLTFEEKEGNIIVKFDNSVQTWEVSQLAAKLGKNIRADVRGTIVTIRDPEKFKEWYEKSIDTNNSIISRIKGIFK